MKLVQNARKENGIPSRPRDAVKAHENHHIIPVVWGGNDHPENLVRFTYRQHYIAHLLLSSLMGSQFPMFAPTSRQYAVMKIKFMENLANMFAEQAKEKPRKKGF
ncbi:HNH endonuclease signature motif containing protein [Siccibacter colletis]|uniref:HNH endonuclease signature motif containing protein n=1 Tax=Siccibacter colletis TaxID=1505757 RepID=UPI003CE75972